MFHKPTNQFRVAKVVNNKLEKSSVEYQKFNKNLLREANILSSLDHPNIIKVHEVLETDTQTAIILEYLPGKSLLEHLNNPLFQTYEAIATIMEKILSALAYLHERGIIHKDIKLENIVLEEADPFSNLKLIDFGFSEIKDESKNYNRSSSGTLIYMAQEVFTMDYDEKCDIWAAGVILYLLLFKELPFTGPTSDDLLEDILTKDLSAMLKKHKGVSREPLITHFLQKLLERDSSKRLSAVEALNHPFIQKYAKKIRIEHSDVQLLKNYQEKTAMELAISSIYVHNLMTAEERSQYVKIFRVLDKSRKGYVTTDDLKSVDFSSSGSSNKLEVASPDQTGRLGLSDLTIACVDIRSRQTMRKIFTYFDKDDDMTVKMDDIYELLKNYVDKRVLSQITEHFRKEKIEEVNIFFKQPFSNL